ncbi:murein L,D-transpeptidase family protein [Erythrobacter sp. THAF29]|uniref:L,D-transpeptidase family protein n=1 Tax=Erythrobacter sp. THAF29 TaxID=2587851 RepID=UPI001267E6CF|nr:L,D-transpeptidase family protein [Erythrobacter sp. THAF29]QFT77110.1 L,D-transpeptidase catalytic domain [Erythrobacter sp. THAF29]
MKRLVALFLLLFAAACAAPPKQVADAQDREIQRSASRAISSPVVQPLPLTADYLIVDKSERLLVAYRDGDPIRAYRGIRFGDAPRGHKRFEGDERTPEGVYTIDRRNPESRFHLSLGISYPNAQDRAYAAQYGRSPGGDIFIHGQPTGYRGPPLPGDWTDGCIALSNAEIEELWRIVPNGTPIEIRP